MNHHTQRHPQNLPAGELCELASEINGSTARTVGAHIEGVLIRYGKVTDEAAHAALNAIRDSHVLQLQEGFDTLWALHRAN